VNQGAILVQKKTLPSHTLLSTELKTYEYIPLLAKLTNLVSLQDV